MTTAWNGPPRSSSRASPCCTDAWTCSALTDANLSRRSSVSRVYRRRNRRASSTGRQVRRCLWHQYGSTRGSRGSRGRSAWCDGRSARREPGRRGVRLPRRTRPRASGSEGAPRPRGAYHARTYGVASAGIRPSASNAPACSCAQRRSRRIASRLWLRVFTRISRQLKPATSAPVASRPDSSDWTSVVPEPANGSST